MTTMVTPGACSSSVRAITATAPAARSASSANTSTRARAIAMARPVTGSEPDVPSRNSSEIALATSPALAPSSADRSTYAVAPVRATRPSSWSSRLFPTPAGPTSVMSRWPSPSHWLRSASEPSRPMVGVDGTGNRELPGANGAPFPIPDRCSPIGNWWASTCAWTCWVSGLGSIPSSSRSADRRRAYACSASSCRPRP